MNRRNYFRENRIAVQKGILESGFLQPLTEDDLPWRVCESNKEALLKEVIIEGIPADEDGIRPKSWILSLEIDKSVFGSPQHTKTTESALILLGSKSLLIFMIELKSHLQPFKGSTLDSVKSKFEDTIGRISMLLPTYIFEKEFDNFPILYKGIICYHNDKDVIEQGKKDPNFAKKDIVKALVAKKGIIQLNDVFKGIHQVEIYFFKKPDSKATSFSIDFKDFFMKDQEYFSALDGDMTCPILRSLP